MIMSIIRRAVALFLALLFLFSASALAAAKNEEFTAREITSEIVQDIPETIQEMLDLAYEQLLEVDGKNLGEKNKYTAWRNNGKWGWCGGFITWLMLEKGIPQQEKNDIKAGEVEGLVHVKEGGVGKLYTGYGRMNRITRIPQKGFIAVYGNVGSGGTTPYYHVGLVYDVEKLDEGRYRITTIEGNVKGHTVRMYVRDYDLNAEKKQKNMSLVPEEERNREESNIFSYGYAYKNKHMYITIFLMPWIPGETTDAAEE